jgi:serine O-acetyltransferase
MERDEFRERPAAETPTGWPIPASGREPSVAEALRLDLAGYIDRRWSPLRKIRTVLSRSDIWIVCLLRWGMWLRRECPRPLAVPLRMLWRPWFALISGLLDTHLSELGEFGPGLFISHHGGIWINPNARLGAFCHIGPGVVIGIAGERRGEQFAPVLGDRVWVGPHAVITGRVRVGNECVIGANSLVVADVPDQGVVVGVPARLISRAGSGHLIPPPGSHQLA